MGIVSKCMGLDLTENIVYLRKHKKVVEIPKIDLYFLCRKFEDVGFGWGNDFISQR